MHPHSLPCSPIIATPFPCHIFHLVVGVNCCQPNPVGVSIACFSHTERPDGLHPHPRYVGLGLVTWGGGGCVGPYPGSSALPPGSCHFCHQLWKVVPWARSCQRLLRGQGEAVDQPAAFPCWEDHSPLSPKGIPGPSSGMVRWRKQVSGRSELHAKMMNSRAERAGIPHIEPGGVGRPPAACCAGDT